ncbi:adenine deaminase C-terminal domain-containing protein [Desulfolucanica intricata]|uniref:adenine deaminase C-terminal domain-containing protein n=1 Tax=Desulfolucanica intricata TaxID=1285191 RepID=UPI00082EB076|nr:adenine deaminase C-terminal domain-containing protein [Desulfolucanica intricata]
MRLRSISSPTYQKLIKTAQGKRFANIFIKNGTVINVYTGELIKAHVAVVDKYIAYVGESEKALGAETKVIDAKGKLLCPGYIEPHGHPFLMYNPVSLTEKILPLGTTMMVADNLFFFRELGPEGFESLIEDLKDLPLKIFWSTRLDPQTFSEASDVLFSSDNLSRLVYNPEVLQVGEITDWSSLLKGKQGMLEGALTAIKTGKKLEGHAPGASVETLNSLAAAGITACHESINGDEVLRRLRLGMYATLRHSSLRPDLTQLIKDIIKAGVPLHRAMLTTDGPSVTYLAQGFNDYVIKTAIEAGLNPVTAYQMATINAAVYYGLDDLVGGIAPGRLADILLLETLDNPTPVLVIADGEIVTGKNFDRRFDGRKYGLGTISKRSVSPDLFLIPAAGKPFPVMHLVNPVITRRRDRIIPERHGLLDISELTGIQYAALLDREGKWVCNGLLSGFVDDLSGLACSSTISGEILAVGKNPEDMARAVNRLYELGGGIVIFEDSKSVFELPLLLNGMISTEPVNRLIQEGVRLEEILSKKGHTYYDPIYTLLFISSTHLPELRLSPEGLLEVKGKSILLPPRKLS